MKQYRSAVSAVVLKPAGVCSPDGCDVQAILLVHKPRTRDAWQLPQGGVEEGETPVQAAKREVMEEAGLTLEGEPFVSAVGYCYDFPPEFLRRMKPINDGQRICFAVFQVPTSVAVKVDAKEIDGYKWVLPEELPKYIDRPEYLTVIKQVLEEYQKKL